VREQLHIYQKLGVKRENAVASLAISEFGTAKPQTEPLHVFLFTGHQIDSPDRPSPRFPGNCEPVARAKIKEVLEAELAGLKGQTLGIAGAASGGDVLFHEVCAEVGINTDVYLALPANAFINESVATGPEALPLLAFALRELADRYATDKVLTLDEYRNEFGGLARSVAHAAEAVYEAKTLSVQEEEDLRRAFRSMVRVDEKGAYVRQRANRKSLPSRIPTS
jgi:hypothetical protein